MIKDNIKNAKSYYNISKNLEIGFEWIKNNDLNSLEDGKYNISENIYANVQTYLTKDTAPYEAHRDYIDIQYMIKGTELSGITNYENCSSIEAYSKEKDIEFLKTDKQEEFFTLNEGEFFVFFPQDAHKPAIKCKNNKEVKKVIVKVGV